MMEEKACLLLPDPRGIAGELVALTGPKTQQMADLSICLVKYWMLVEHPMSFLP